MKNESIAFSRGRISYCRISVFSKTTWTNVLKGRDFRNRKSTTQCHQVNCQLLIAMRQIKASFSLHFNNRTTSVAGLTRNPRILRQAYGVWRIASQARNDGERRLVCPCPSLRQLLNGTKDTSINNISK
jgi:hypothetical protein